MTIEDARPFLKKHVRLRLKNGIEWRAMVVHFHGDETVHLMLDPRTKHGFTTHSEEYHPLCDIESMTLVE